MLFVFVDVDLLVEQGKREGGRFEIRDARDDDEKLMSVQYIRVQVHMGCHFFVQNASTQLFL